MLPEQKSKSETSSDAPPDSQPVSEPSDIERPHANEREWKQFMFAIMRHRLLRSQSEDHLVPSTRMNFMRVRMWDKIELSYISGVYCDRAKGCVGTLCRSPSRF